MATKTKKTAAPVTAAPVAVPAAVRGTATAKPASASNMLAALAAKAKPVDAKAQSKAGRPVLPLSAAIQSVVVDFAETKELFDAIEAHLEVTKGQMNPELSAAWLEVAWQLKNQPASPRIIVNRADGKPDVEAMYIVQEKWHVQAQDSDTLKNMLVAAGIAAENADKIVAEVSYDPFVGIRDFQEMSVGKKSKDGYVNATPAEQALTKKLMEVVMSDKFTDEERGLMLYTKPNSRVKEGFLQRVAGFCQTKDQLAAVLAIIKPTAYAKGAKIGVSDTPADHLKRLTAKAADLLGQAGPANEEE